MADADANIEPESPPRSPVRQPGRSLAPITIPTPTTLSGAPAPITAPLFIPGLDDLVRRPNAITAPWDDMEAFELKPRPRREMADREPEPETKCTLLKPGRPPTSYTNRAAVPIPNSADAGANAPALTSAEPPPSSARSTWMTQIALGPDIRSTHLAAVHVPCEFGTLRFVQCNGMSRDANPETVEGMENVVAFRDPIQVAVLGFLGVGIENDARVEAVVRLICTDGTTREISAVLGAAACN